MWQLSTSDSLDRYRSDSVPYDICWSPRDNALAFVDESGQLGLWHEPVPGHLPSPNSDPAGAVAAAAEKHAEALDHLDF